MLNYIIHIAHTPRCVRQQHETQCSMCANKASIHGGKLINLSGQQIYRTMALEMGEKILFIIPFLPLCVWAAIESRSLLR